MTEPPTPAPAAGSELAHSLQITRADHFAVYVADYDQSVRFYTEQLGFRLDIEWSLGDTFPELRFRLRELGRL